MTVLRSFLLAVLAIGAPASSALASDTCEALSGFQSEDAVIVRAQEVAEGPFSPQITYGQSPTIDLPTFCQVDGVASPVSGSRIGFAVWLPQDGWNGRLRMFGNGGYGSSMPELQMALALAQGFAVTATDTGHIGDDPDFAIGRPESIVDWGHRAVHRTIVAAKSVVERHYGAPADYAYFEGCSTGGHQALMEAQRFPDDFDGIVAGAPGHNRTALNIGFLWQFVANHRADGSLILPREKLPLLTGAALQACGGEREQARGYLENPLACQFDPAVLRCSSDDGTDCLTDEEVEAARRLYAGARNPRTGEQIYPAFVPGSEMGWFAYWADPRVSTQPARANFFRFWAFDDPAWDWRSFDFDHAVQEIDQEMRAAIDAIAPDLTAFASAGGKLLMYHGLADPVVSPTDTFQYVDAVGDAVGGERDRFLRLYGVPGMGHCAGGPGPHGVEWFAALQDWVERGSAPRALVARGSTPAAASSTLCPYGSAGDACRRAQHQSTLEYVR